MLAGDKVREGREGPDSEKIYIYKMQRTPLTIKA